MQHTHNTRSRGSVDQTNPSPTIDANNAPECSQRNNAVDKTAATNQIVNKKSSPVNTGDNVELDFSIAEDLKRTRASISLFELSKIAQFRNEIVNALPSRVPKIPHQLITNIHIQDSAIDGVAIGQKSRSITPPFLLTFEIFNNNVHNCMVDFGASSNVMHFSVCQKLNVVPKKSNIQIVQLDISKVRVMGEMKNVLIRLSVDFRVHQTIDILVVDISEAYVLLLRRDWSSQLNDYFAINWSHLRLPYNGKPNQIRVERERYMKHTVTELEAPNEPIMFINTILGNYCFDTFFGDFLAEESPVLENVISELMFCDHEPTPRDDE